METARDQSELPCMFLSFTPPTNETSRSKDQEECLVFSVAPEALARGFLECLERMVADHIGSALAKINLSGAE